MTTVHTPQSQMRQMKGVILFIAVMVLLVIFLRIIGLITEWFWFQEVGYQTIFTVTLLAKIKTGALFGAGFFIIFCGSLLIALHLSRVPLFGDQAGAAGFRIPLQEMGPGLLKVMIPVAALLFALFAAANGSAQWENLLLFLNPSPFGVSDPLFPRPGSGRSPRRHGFILRSSSPSSFSGASSAPGSTSTICSSRNGGWSSGRATPT
ncbi:MAG: UPF0182 family protein [Deltaproteobacteria bacterium]|nr:UPF0182 family protein [Deltaproteobacteria bacterium]